ncbi:hypothetical protein [Lignipirellula cremea]|uniref:Uncharacterized protein n=1 Tax=Lignipirellula cremea TaxID=2528010 RepID=A0A518E2F4_9BACT|nr:hypothetical protein [Lignipirellula cremea]QDU98275.1 hypothetical protein Pla8534_61370 [Lignipirellula cremea]
MLGAIIISAAILGAIVMTIEDGDFPGWIPLTLCCLAASLPAVLINYYLPPGWFILGLAVGAVTGGCALSALLGMSVKRACMAAAIYLAAKVCLALLILLFHLFMTR